MDCCPVSPGIDSSPLMTLDWTWKWIIMKQLHCKSATGSSAVSHMMQMLADVWPPFAAIGIFALLLPAACCIDPFLSHFAFIPEPQPETALSRLFSHSFTFVLCMAPLMPRALVVAWIFQWHLCSHFPLDRRRRFTLLLYPNSLPD